MGGSSDDLNSRYHILESVWLGIHVFAPNIEAHVQNFDHLHFQADPMLSDIQPPKCSNLSISAFSHSLSQRCQFCWGACQRDARTGYLQLFIYLFIFLGPFRNSLPRVRDPMHDGAQTCEVPGMGPFTLLGTHFGVLG